jgi:hypothetical protein
VSDDIREAVADLLAKHINFFDDDLADAPDALLERFLVVPRDQVTTEYGVLYSNGESQRAVDHDNAAMIARIDRKHPGIVRDHNPQLASRSVLPWTVIPLPEDGDPA